MHLTLARSRFICLALLLLPTIAAAQDQPLPLPVSPSSPQQQTMPTIAAPLILPTPTPDPYASSGRQGLLVETVAGRTVLARNADEQFNPASAVKVATALAALRNFGADHRFTTSVWTNGEFDVVTNTIRGDLFVAGRDPSFNDAHAVLVARELNRLGVRTVTGDLIVAPQFTLNYSSSALRSGERFYDVLDATRRPSSASRAWLASRDLASDRQAVAPTTPAPSVAVMGAVYTGTLPAGARSLVSHKSSTLTDILKVLLSYSNNFMAARIGDTMGGADGLERFLVGEVGLAPAEVRLASTSGLGVNRVSPRAMMRIYREFVEELAHHNLRPSDVLPVAGIDPGTLKKRFTAVYARGSVIAKTGTLIRTDGGASALVGQMRTAAGETLYFVIFNGRGSVNRFRGEQDRIIAHLQSERGGPLAFAYTPRLMESRLIATDIDRTTDAMQAEEFEAESN